MKLSHGGGINIAEKVDGENKLIFSPLRDGDIIEWTLDSNWERVSSVRHEYQSTSYNELERAVQIDIDGDGIIGG